MCYLTTDASAPNKTTDVPFVKIVLLYRKALTTPVSSPRTTLALLPIG
jgi:hypothetical protein